MLKMHPVIAHLVGDFRTPVSKPQPQVRARLVQLDAGRYTSIRPRARVHVVREAGGR